MLQRFSDYYSFLRLTHVALYVESLFCLPIHLAGRHWVVSTFDGGE